MRKVLACGAVLASVMVAPASAQPQVAGALGQCLGIFGAVERLACYDRVARSVNPNGAPPQQAAPQSYAPYAAPAAVAAVPAARPPAPYVPPAAAYAAPPAAVAAAPPASYVPPPAAYAAAPVAVAPGAQTNAQQFGSEYLAAAPAAKGGPRAVNTIESMVQSFRFTTGHRFVVLLENGQEWKQIEGDTARPNLTSLKTRSVTISRGLLGSYNLVFSDQSGSYKVERTL